MKTLIHNNYLDVRLGKVIALGIGYDNQELMIIMGPILVEVKLWMFKRPRRIKPSKYEVEIQGRSKLKPYIHITIKNNNMNFEITTLAEMNSATEFAIELDNRGIDWSLKTVIM